MKKYKYLTKTITLPNGTRKYIRGKTKAELEEKMMKAKAEIGAGIDLSQDVTFTEFAQTWYTIYKEPRLRENSKRSVKQRLNVHILPYLGGMRMRDIKPTHIQQVMNGVQDKKHATQVGVRQIMREIFNNATENSVITKSPVISSVKAEGERSKERVPLTSEQSEDLLRAAWGTKSYLFTLIALSTGMRYGEILGLRWEDVDFKAGRINVCRNWANTTVTEHMKTPSSVRKIPMPNRLLAYLKLIRPTDKSVYVIHENKTSPP